MIPPPKLCPDCRLQRRVAWRNERFMYKRKCDATGKDIISMYPPDSPFKIYEQSVWWGDSWNALDYGRDFDFNRPFFEQSRELQLEVPRLALVNKNSKNSQFTNHSADNKTKTNTYQQMECVDQPIVGCLLDGWVLLDHGLLHVEEKHFQPSEAGPHPGGALLGGWGMSCIGAV